jgi:futalosine hydrolase
MKIPNNDSMKNIVILAATAGEIVRLADSFQGEREPPCSPWCIYAARLGFTRILFVVTGVGIANAAAATTSMIHLYSPDLLIITGCAGAYPGSGLAIGDLVLATTEVFADEGVAVPEGWQDLEYMGVLLLDRNGSRFFNEIPLSPRAADRAMSTAQQNSITLHRGTFLSVSTCSGTHSRGKELSDRFGGICENMEGAAVALVAARFGVDCLEVRGISNQVEDRDPSRWDIPLAAANAQDFIGHLIRTL